MDTLLVIYKTPWGYQAEIAQPTTVGELLQALQTLQQQILRIPITPTPREGQEQE